MDDERDDDTRYVEKVTEPEADPAETEESLAEKVGAKVTRKLRARRRAKRGVAWGLGMMGMIGWSVAVPTLLGVLVGRWLDSESPGGRSWTLALLAAGLVIGCMNAWHWVGKESKAERDMEEEDGK